MSRGSIVVLLASVLAACSSSTPDGGSSSSTGSIGGSGSSTSGSSGTGGTSGSGSTGSYPEQLHGQIVFRGLGEGTAFRAEVYRAPFTNSAPRTVADDHCDIVASPGEGDNIWTTPPDGDVDLGATLTASSSALTLVATVPDGGPFDYEAAQAGEFGFGATFTLTNSGTDVWPGGTLATVRVPGQVFPVPQEVDTTQGPVTVSYSGGDGADYFHVRVEITDQRIDCYPASRTAFTLPSNVMAIVPSTITPLVSAESVRYLDTNAGRIALRISSDNLD